MIAFDATSNGSTSSSSLSFSHTCTGADRYLCAAVNSNNQTATTITYNGVSLSQIIGATTERGMWGLVAPATGANTFVATWTGVNYLTAVLASYTGVHQTTSVSGAQETTATSTTPSVSVTSETGDLVVGYSHWADSSGSGRAHTPGTGQTERVDVNGNDGVLVSCISDEAGATSVTHSYTRTGSTTIWEASAGGINLEAAGASSAAIPPGRPFGRGFSRAFRRAA